MTDKAIQLLNNSQVVAIPTETVYGLAAKIDDEKALNQVFQIKERPFFDPLIVHTSSVEMTLPLVKDFNDIAKKLAQDFWPGPLTMVMDKSDQVNSIITAGLDRVGIRIPNHSLTIDLIKKLNCPLAAPSANKFKKTSPTKVAHVKDEFNDKVYVLDGGDCEVGIESTVVGIFESEVHIYRPGMITIEDLKKSLENRVAVKYHQSPVAPGQLEHHYMPKSPLTICDETFDYKKEDYSIWKLPNDPILVARDLYTKLRELDDNRPILFILNQSFKKEPKWDGILNRLKKAKTKDYFF